MAKMILVIRAAGMFNVMLCCKISNNNVLVPTWDRNDSMGSWTKSRPTPFLIIN